MIRGQVETREAKEDQMQERAGMLQTFTGASRTNLGTYQRRPLNSENEQKTKKEQRLDCRVEEVRRKGDTSEGKCQACTPGRLCIHFSFSCFFFVSEPSTTGQRSCSLKLPRLALKQKRQLRTLPVQDEVTFR